MKLPLRFKLRTLLLFVAITALVMGLGIEWSNHRHRDHWAESEAVKLGEAVRLYQQVAECAAADARGFPYPSKDRRGRFQREWRGWPVLLDFNTWGGEGGSALYWADRIHAEAQGAEEQKLRFQRRLLLP